MYACRPAPSGEDVTFDIRSRVLAVWTCTVTGDN